MHTWGKRSCPKQGAHLLGWIGLGIGLTELLAPRQVQTMLGLEPTPDGDGTLRTLGLREAMHALSILAHPADQQSLSTALHGRIIGDVLDTALLAVAAKRTHRPAQFAAIAASVAAVGALDVYHWVRLALGSERFSALA